LKENENIFKDVSLVMIYDKDGKILWHKGRKIKGKSIDSGEGFSKSFIKENVNEAGAVVEKNVAVNVYGNNLSSSARHLHIKSLITLPVREKEGRCVQTFKLLPLNIRSAFTVSAPVVL
jgi:hypothetical protein